MKDTIIATHGSCIRLECVFRDETGAPEDVSTDRFEIRDALPASLAQDLVIVPVDPGAGRLELHLEAEPARKLNFGRINHFRIARLMDGGCADVSTLLWIEIA